ncbi:hypothetical protein VP1G_10774 [Cytospora mali]|uniref:Anaphase-promoting complex subunit 11 n=1 Tax=Cytospora mali TaxID=578113 RepID=A0A194UW34_CYTMA|nr:hypothetical protein VP1G_10774 [Valsa mali var. pyri (nom. inval.)]
MKVKIKKWAAVATWRWDIPDDDYLVNAATTFTNIASLSGSDKSHPRDNAPCVVKNLSGRGQYHRVKAPPSVRRARIMLIHHRPQRQDQRQGDGGDD